MMSEISYCVGVAADATACAAAAADQTSSRSGQQWDIRATCACSRPSLSVSALSAGALTTSSSVSIFGCFDIAADAIVQSQLFVCELQNGQSQAPAVASAGWKPTHDTECW